MFEDLNDDEWARIAPLAADEPVHPHRRGRPRAETRIVANAVLWILTTGERWSKLPARYPSGPTCRRRFDEWLADGTLIEIVKILSEGGRVFTYVPQPQPVAPEPPKQMPAPESPRLRGVFWTNPESWQQAAGACSYRAGDLPIASSRTLHNSGSAHPPMREFAPHGAPAISVAEIHKRSDDYCGYTIHAIAQPATRQMTLSYRASAEIVKDGKRVERSGLIGPPFPDHEGAQRHALEWARDWIDRRTSAVAVMTSAGADANAAFPAERAEGGAEPAPRAATIADLAAVGTVGELGADSAERQANWLLHQDGRGDSKPPEVVYHA
ncbi:transposase [Trinickia sp. EG282A]|uniref:transposase n=1 Tax=Trinickia sp. EG282A TaxID=3237013 RepID=UPI0034D32107